MMCTRRWLVVVSVMFGSVTPLLAQDYRYAVFELPDLGSPLQFDAPGGINQVGDAVGGAGFAVNDLHATFWPSTGGVVDLGTLGGDDSGAASINDVGDIAGWAGFQPNSSIYIRRACIWRNGKIIDLGTLGGESSFANAMNDMGQVVGEAEYEFTSYRLKAFLWQNGGMSVLPAPFEGVDGRAAYDINNNGEAVGYGGGLDQQYNGLLWRDGQVFDLGSLSGRGSYARGINDTGVIVGDSITANELRHAVRWVNQQIEDIHTSSIGTQSLARDINNLGQIVGENNNVVHPKAWILNPGEDMIFLDDLVPPRLRMRWRVYRATEINDAGQIPVTADVPSNLTDSWALLLSPVQPTMDLAAPAPGSAGVANTITVSDVTPGARVVFLYSKHGGGTRIPGCDLQQNALQLDNPTVIGTATANQNGVATITRPVPLIARGQTILFQAVVQNKCAISQLVVHEFQ